MAHWAKIDENGLVVTVTVGNNDHPNEGYDWLVENIGGLWVKTSYNTRGGVHYTDGEPSEDQTKALRFNYAGIGFTYDDARDAFIPPKPYDSWVLDEDTCLWVPPVAMPDDADTVEYVWDENITDWAIVSDD
jgi:hypothetical protein